VAALQRELPSGSVRADLAELARYASDASGLRAAAPPAAVVLPENTAEVQTAMRVASALRAPVVVRGAGSGLESVVAAAGVTAQRLAGEEADRMVELRRSGRGSKKDTWHVGEDVAVPRSRLVEMIAAIEEIGARYGLEVGCVAHAGDGNLHVGLSVPMAPGEVEPPAPVHAAADRVVRTALELGGTITGEHGVGALKRPWLARELGTRQLQLQRSVKDVFDPLGILAPDSFLAAP
jgi:glycolate oxidase